MIVRAMFSGVYDLVKEFEKRGLRIQGLQPTLLPSLVPHNSMWHSAMASASAGNQSRPSQDSSASSITRLLRAAANGDSGALDDLVPLVYDTLRQVARRQLRRERKDHTLTSTALVHEAYLELSRQGDLHFNDRNHFYAAAAQTMRHILIDYAVRRKAQKRGGDRARVPFEEIVLASDDHIEDLVTVDQALQQLEEVDERLVRIVECRFFAGMTIAETATALNISDATVSRDWVRARAWLNREILKESSS